MTWEIYSIYLVTLAVFFAGPPDSTELLTVLNSMRYGPKKNIATIAGDLTANMVQMCVAAFGLAALIAATPWALGAIKWAGVAYLVFLGIKLLVQKSVPTNVEPHDNGTPGKLFWQGFVTAAANPFAVVFFAALFPQFLNPNTALAPQLLILGATYIFIDGSQLFAYGWAADKGKTRLTWLQGPALSKLSGGLLIAAALLLAFKDFRYEEGLIG